MRIDVCEIENFVEIKEELLLSTLEFGLNNLHQELRIEDERVEMAGQDGTLKDIAHVPIPRVYFEDALLPQAI